MGAKLRRQGPCTVDRARRCYTPLKPFSLSGGAKWRFGCARVAQGRRVPIRYNFIIILIIIYARSSTLWTVFRLFYRSLSSES